MSYNFVFFLNLKVILFVDKKIRLHLTYFKLSQTLKISCLNFIQLTRKLLTFYAINKVKVDEIKGVMYCDVLSLFIS